MRTRKLLYAPLAFVLLLVAVPRDSSAGRAAEVRVLAFELLNQGVTAYKNGDYADAVVRLRKSSSMALNSFRAHFYLGLALIGDRRYEDALEALSVALDLDPDHVQSLVATGDANLKLGDLTESQASFFRALKLRPEYPPALDGLARFYEAQADEEKAVEHYRRSIAADRGFAPAYTHLGDLYLRTDRFQEAVRLLEEAVQVRPDFAAGLNRLSIAYGRLGMSNEAIAAIQKAMSLEPKNAEHPATLGHLQMAEGSLGAAEESFNRSLDLDSGQPNALEGLAEIARRQGDYELAVEQLDVALDDSRLDALRAARVRQFREQIVAEQARAAALQRALDEQNAESDQYAELARLYAGRGRWAEAVDLQRRVAPSDEQRELLAYLLFRDGSYREAFDLYDALARETATAAAWLNRGVTQASLGDDRGAIASYRTVLDREPDHGQALLYLGNALLRSGDSAEAITTYRRFLESDPSGETAERVRRILARLAPPAEPESEPETEGGST